MRKLKNIVIINDYSYITGGAGSVAINSAIELKRKGFQVYFFSAVEPIDNSLIEENIIVYSLRQKRIVDESNKIKAFLRGIYNYEAAFVLKSILLKLNPDETIIHLHAWVKALSPSILNILRFFTFPVVISMHDYFTFCPNGGLYNYKYKRICSVKPSSLKCYFSNCDSRNFLYKIFRNIRQIFQNYYLSKIKNLNIIALGNFNKTVSFIHLKKYVAKWFELQNPISVGTNSIVDISKNNYYLYIGRLSPEKGVELFCKAVTDLHLSAFVMGDGPLKQKLQRLYPNISFLGWCNNAEKTKYLHKAKALVFPSVWYEGSPLTTIEAKSFGIPCIVSRGCAAEEQITDGVDGFLFEMNNLISLKNVILKFEKCDLRVLSDNIRKSFNSDYFSLATHICKLQEIYSLIMK